MNVGDILVWELADNVQEEWDAYREEGCSAQEATTLLIEQYKEMIEEEEEVLLYATLGILQLEEEQMDVRVKEEVDEIIRTKYLDEYLQDSKLSKKVMNQLKKKCR